MQQSNPRLFKIKPEKFEIWQAWCKKLQTELSHDARKTIANEGELYEFFITFQIDGTYYALGAAVMPPGVQTPRPADPNLPINQQHKQIKQDCLEPIESQAAFSYLLAAH